MRSTRRQHQQTVDAKRDPGAVGQTRGECREQVLIDGEGWHAAPPPLLVVRFETLALLDARGELMVAVGKLHAVTIELEALRGARIVGVPTRESRLRGGI